ncbi:MAG: SCP2 sterol-binding domain-containing protein [Anaerolineae bacterium]
MSTKTARQLIEEMPETFQPERAGRAAAVVQFHISGEDGGEWFVTIKNKTCTVTEGVTESADATIRVDSDDYVALSSGQLSSTKAFMSGKVKATGNVALLRRMDRWFIRRP